jgi:putative restriction endonuclease
MARDLDSAVRAAAFRFLEEQTMLRPDGVLPRTVLANGFVFGGIRVPLLGPQGIFKPAVLELPLSITTVPAVEGRPRPYEDEIGPDGLVRYRYRGTDPRHRDNEGLRRAMDRQVPLAYFHGVVRGLYSPAWPAFIVGDDPARLTFTVAVDDRLHVSRDDPEAARGVAEARRSYVTTLTLKRIHQQAFRERVLRAYQEHCAICRLRRRELLEASHILPDHHPRGEPTVPNGIALCKLHHAAFDRNILGIRPDLEVEIRLDVLREVDGPMLIHGLQGFQGTRLTVPRRSELRPNPEFLAERYEEFRRAG